MAEVKAEDVLIPLYDPMNKLVAFGNLARPADRALQAVRALAAAVAVAGRKKVLLVGCDTDLPPLQFLL